MEKLENAIKAKAIALGYDGCGIIETAPFQEFLAGVSRRSSLFPQAAPFYEKLNGRVVSQPQAVLLDPEITAAIEQMAVGSQQVAESAKQIDALSRNASGETQSVSAATEEQLATMEEVASSSQALAKLAMNLQSEINKFQI